MDRKSILLALAPALACVAVGIWVTQGQNSWVPRNYWLAPLLFGTSVVWTLLVWQWPRLASAKAAMAARFRGDYRYVQAPFRFNGSRLEIGSFRSGNIRVKAKVFSTVTLHV